MPAGFPSRDQQVGIHEIAATIRGADHALSGATAELLRETNLTVRQYTTLLVLADSPDLSGAHLARLCLVTPQSMAAILAKLAARNLVERSPSQVHERVLLTKLSGDGWALLRKAELLTKSADERLAAALRPSERRQLRDYLRRVVTAFDETEA
ncbi:MarR family winged helix-turn-helix transcriptional regulator [Actinokineospora iranica]|uniref:DNA-binding transcriptional regulator, MarR family n=1 Tax=Actinokineospora iranica TaxID=1271860 RepID=A0A1G6SR45_9PSEU|nr:MarR family winged helix-turn-helix transcriptional regulator [Actinokineospora iranica]SDD18625.1 DNA-binding transcriptional regulator, MarR family [Actinokineospora iranica]